jgi:hypothetical protein
MQQVMFKSQGPALSDQNRDLFSTLLGRPPVSPEDAQAAIRA